jgi:hypothetical protein
MSGLYIGQASRVVLKIIYNYMYIIMNYFLYLLAYVYFSQEIGLLTYERTRRADLGLYS